MNQPVADAGQDTLINCYFPMINLDGSGSSAGLDDIYDWTTLDGNIVSGENTTAPLVDAVGTYELSVMDTISGCLATAQVVVSEDITPPISDAGSGYLIDCDNLTISLDGTNSSAGNEFLYLWTTSNGNILSGENTLQPIVDAFGTYELLVTNNTNGCQAISSTMVVVDTIPPIASAGEEVLLTCIFPTATLDGTTSSSGNEFLYQWTTPDGNILSGENTTEPIIDEPGTYYISVENNLNGCMATDSVAVSENVNQPVADAGLDTLINCYFPMINLDGSGSSAGVNDIYEWTTLDGNIVLGETTTTPQINALGTYEIVVTDTISGCSASDQVVVSDDFEFPIADAGNDMNITCAEPIVILDGNNSSIGLEFSYNWTTVFGNILTGENTLTPEVDSGGIYTLMVTNLNNGCTASSTTVIFIDTLPPIADAGDDMVINCSSPTITLDGTNSSTGIDIIYQWTTQDGNILSDPTSTEPSVDSIGTYELMVTNTSNGCIDQDVVLVTIDTIAPIADAGLDTMLDCEITTSLLGGNSSAGIGINYQWLFSPGGNIISGENEANALVNSGAVYTLVVTDSNNGCSASDDAEVTQDVALPFAEAGTSIIIPCMTGEISLDGSASDFGVTIIYEWTTVDGNIVSGTNTLFPTVDAGGIYTLSVTDTLNNCMSSDNVLVTYENCNPDVVATVNGVIDCNNPTIFLDGTGSSEGADISYLWTTINGNILSGETTLTPEVDQVGTYYLTVEDSFFGTSATDSVVVADNFILPTVTVSVNDMLTCTNAEILVSGNGSSSSPEFTHAWTTNGGNIVAILGDLDVMVDEPGMYILEITNNLNGCTAVDSIEVFQEILAPIANAGANTELNCFLNEVSLDASGSSNGNNYTYLWTTQDGNIVSATDVLNPLVNAAGTYEILVSNIQNGCTAISSVEVSIDTLPPTADAGFADLLTCSNSILTLDGTASSSGNEFTYSWVTLDGNIITGANTQTPEIDATGTYEILIANSQNGCTATASVQIEADTLPPTVIIEQAPGLDCALTSVQLDANNSSTGSNFIYQWTTFDGNIISGDQTLTPVIDQSGTYDLLITNFENGCTNLSDVTVLQDTTPPVAEAGLPDELTCSTTILTLDGSGSSSGSSFSYEWTTMNGNILSGDNSLFPTINSTGIYQLEVTDSNNNCTATDAVEITENITPPIAIIETPEVLNCEYEIISLEAGNSSADVNSSYLWTTNNGNIISGENSLTPLVDSGGDYELLITNAQNGCTNVASVMVFQDTLFPIADAGQEFILDCQDTLIVLNGTGSSTGNNFEYFWTTNSGNILSGENTLTPSINEPGTYQLEVLNTNNQCSASDAVLIGENIDTPIPVIDAIGGLTLNCDNSSLVLNANGSVPLGGLSYEWSTPDGNILSGSTTANPEVDLAGNYFFDHN